MSAVARRRLVKWLPIGFVLFVVGFFVWQVVTIQLRLWRNGAIASQVAQSLRERFPGVDARGGASYEREVIYIGVYGVDNRKRPEIAEWLRAHKQERKIAPEIWLRFDYDDDHEVIR